METVLEIKNLQTYIRQKQGVVKAVDGVSLTVSTGETLGVVGESGCGKSMMGLSIMRLLPPGGYIAGGSILLNGHDIVATDERGLQRIRGSDVGMIFQDPMTSLNPTMNIGKQISEVVTLHRGVSRKEGLKRAEEVLDLVGMPHPKERLSDFPHQLSGGLRQRVMIAMALACEPKLLIADEPTTALDVTIQAQILSLIDRLKKELNMAVILVTHDMGVIAGRANRVLVMYAGRIAETADTNELFYNTQHRYTQALLEAIPRLDDDAKRRLYSIPGLPPSLMDPPSGCRFAARCRFAEQDCTAADPPMSIVTASHQYACFHPVGAHPSQPALAAGAPSSPPSPGTD